MVLIYETTATAATIAASNGLGALMPSSCIVGEETNGNFDLTMTHPIDAYGKWARIQKDRIIVAPCHRGDQPFRIYAIDAEAIPGSIVVTARHVFYDLLGNLVELVSPSGTTGAIAGAQILAACQYATDFTFASDITTALSTTIIKQNPVAAFLGSDDSSFINVWGGEIVRNGWAIAINTRIGADNGYKILYRKNLAGLKLKENTDARYTRIMPIATDADGNELLLPETYVDSSDIADNPYPIIGTVTYSDIKVLQETDGVIPYPTADDAYTEMRARVADLYASGQNLATYTLEVSFVAWQDTEEYKAFAPLFTVAMGDDVTVDYLPLGISDKLRVASVKWDCLRGRYTELRIGDKVSNLATSLAALQAKVRIIEAEIFNISRGIGIYVGEEVPPGIQHHDLFVDTDDTSRYDVSTEIAVDCTLTLEMETQILNPTALITVTLPATTANVRAAGCVGTIMRMYNCGTFPAIVAAGAGETINGLADLRLYPGESVEIVVMAVGEWVS